MEDRFNTQADIAIYRELGGTKCSCGKSKGARKSFCSSCYRKLPASLQRRLYEQDGYCNVVREAYAYLAGALLAGAAGT